MNIELPVEPPGKWVSTAFGATSRGRCRKTNEDSFLCHSEQGIWLVADGVGGNAGGKIASQLVCDELPALLLSGTSLRGAIAQIHARVKLAAQLNGGQLGMATTVVIARQHEDVMELCWVGDSRAYVYNEHSLKRLTRDHSLVQRLQDMGLGSLSETCAAVVKNVLTKCVGSLNIDILNAESVSIRLAASEKLLLCSDGLTNELKDSEIWHIISQAVNTETAIEQLLSAANQRGGKDNITAILIDAPRVC